MKTISSILLVFFTWTFFLAPFAVAAKLPPDLKQCEKGEKGCFLASKTNVSTVTAKQLYKAPLPSFVKRCRQSKKGCFLYTHSQHEALMILLSIGDEARDQVSMYKRLEKIRQASIKQRKREQELASKERALLKKKNGFLRETITEHEKREVALRKDLLLTRERNKDLRKRIDSESLIKQPVVYIGAVLIGLVGVGAGFILANVTRPQSATATTK